MNRDDKSILEDANSIPAFIQKFDQRLKDRKKARELTEVASQLPLWKEDHRGIPNAVARSALFRAANQNQTRTYLKKRVIASLNSIQITYTGEELRTVDEDVFLQIVHLCRLSPAGDMVEFSGYSMLKSLGWNFGKKDYDRLKECLDRLNATSVAIEMKDDSSGYAGSMIRRFAWQDEEGNPLKRWRVWLEPQIVQLFNPNAFTLLDWDVRSSLPTLAKKLFTFFSTHADPSSHAYSIETLRSICGSDAKDNSSFKRNLTSALDILVEIQFLEKYTIRGQLVTVFRSHGKRIYALAR